MTQLKEDAATRRAAKRQLGAQLSEAEETLKAKSQGESELLQLEQATEEATREAAAKQEAERYLKEKIAEVSVLENWQVGS